MDMKDAEITIAMRAVLNMECSDEQIYRQRCSLEEWETLLNRRKYKRKFRIDESDDFAQITFLASHYGIWRRRY
jgi:hypothetical protein